MEQGDARAGTSGRSQSSRRRLLVEGRVQGVGYRVTCARQARAAGLAGWVRNLGDGREEVILQGTPDAVSEIERWCSRGPRMAMVTNVSASDEPPVPDIGGFEIR
jgi:acylphosphatase